MPKTAELNNRNFLIRMLYRDCYWHPAFFIHFIMLGCIVSTFFIQIYDDESSVKKTTEPIEMPFGLSAWMGPRNHVLDGCPAVLRDVAMATNLGLKLLLTGFV